MILGDDSTLTPTRLRRHLPIDLQSAPIQLTYHTPESLRTYLRRWSRFGVHLRSEGQILIDPDGELAALLAVKTPLSTDYEVAAQRSHLDQYLYVNRFGGRMLGPLAHLYRIGRTLTFAILAQRGVFEFDREVAFIALIRLEPSLRDDVEAVSELQPFHDRLRDPDCSSPLAFEPNGDGAITRFIAARESVYRLLTVAEAL
jgi:hypothetical protein